MADTMARERPNLFDVLKLDPNMKLSVADVTELLEKKRGEFSELAQGNSLEAHRAKLVLDYYSELLAVANDPKKQADEAEKAKGKRKEEQDAKRARFNAELKMATVRGNVYVTEIAHWKQEYADVLSLSEIESAINVPIQHEATSIDERYLPPEVGKEVQDDLALLGHESLYELLKRSETADKEALLEAADYLRRSTLKTMRKTAFVDATGRLAGRAKNIFRDEQQRQRYDATLRRQRVRRAAQPLESACSADKMLHGAQADLLVEMVASQYGMSEQAALDELKLLAIDRKWAILPGRIGSQTGQGDSRRVDELEAQVRNLQEQNKQIATLQRELSKESGDKSALMDQLKRAQAERLLTEQALERSRQRLETVQRLQQERETRDKERRRQGIAQRQQRIEALMTTRNYCQAQRELESVAPRPVEWADLARTIADHIESAHRKLDEAKAERDIGRAEQIAREALDEVTDFEPAKKWLKERAPAAPRNLRVHVDNGVARLSWDPSGSVDVRYVVVRSIDAPARAWVDGYRVGETTDLELIDADIPPGERVYYSVYARRGGLSSNSSATITEPAMSLPDVTDLRKEVDDATIALSWTPPSGVRRISVTRWENSQSTHGANGTAVWLTGDSSLRDSGLANGQPYNYLVQCVYGYGTDERTSLGRRVTATPTALPAAVPTLGLQLDISQLGFTSVRFDALKPERGDLYVLKCSTRIPVVGEKLIEEDLSRMGRLIPIAQRDTLLESAVVTYVPVVILEGTALVGEAVRQVWIEDVQGLSVEDQAESVRLRWRWPSRATDVEIRRSGNVVSGEKALVARVARNAGERDGSYAVVVGPGHSPDFVVMAGAILEGERMMARGVRITCPRRPLTPEICTVTYRFQSVKRPLSGRHRKLVLQTNGLRALPPLVVRVKRGEPPCDANDGRLLEMLRPIEVSKSELEVFLKADGVESDTYGALFFEDEQSGTGIELRPLDRGAQRID